MKFTFKLVIMKDNLFVRYWQLRKISKDLNESAIDNQSIKQGDTYILDINYYSM